MARAYESKLKALEKRLAAIERAQLKRVYEPIAREFGMDPDELMDEAERFLAQPLAAQLAQVDHLFTDWCAEGHDPAEFDVDAIKQCLMDPTAAHAEKIRLYRPSPGPPDVTTVLQRVWEAQPTPEKATVSDRTPRRPPAPEPTPEPVPAPVDDDDEADPELVAKVQDLLRQLGPLS